MYTNIQKWGNSQGIRIPKNILDEIKLDIDEKVEITTKDNTIIIKKAENKRRKTIQELFKDYNENYEPEKIDWGKTEGKELW